MLDDSDDDFFAGSSPQKKKPAVVESSPESTRGSFVDMDHHNATHSYKDYTGRTTKKARIAALLSDDETMEDQDEVEEDEVVTTFSRRLTKFKPVAKAKPKRKRRFPDQSDTF